MRLLTRRQYTTIPGPIVERQVRVPVEGDPYASGGLFGCFHKPRVTATVAYQCPPRVVAQRVFVSRPVVRNFTETSYVRETMRVGRCRSPRAVTWPRSGSSRFP